VSIDFGSYQAKNVPKTEKDSLIQMFAQQFVSNAESTIMTIPTIDSVLVYTDSSIVKSIPINSETNINGQKVQVNTKNSVLKDGLSYSIGKDGQISESERDVLTFKPLGKTERILNYECELWVSEDGTMKVWATKKLPFLLSPGFKMPKSIGGVLKLELNEDNSQIISEIQQIKL
jgi:hypothetical protein